VLLEQLKTKLMFMSKYDRSDVRRAAVEAIARIAAKGDQAIIITLMERLSDSDINVGARRLMHWIVLQEMMTKMSRMRWLKW